ncbi:trypsin-like peptidase domain-containing protein [Agromyces sp. NPDC057865]|uniref:trypsin-like peptidase domain-containing protein n=1 Tax=Agromyces sp. NPDC057865 TaxID=3346267 RepID=UPI00366E44EF
MITERAVARASVPGPLAVGLAGLFAAAMVLSVAPTARAEETVEQQIEKSILLVGTTYSGYVLVPYDDGNEWEPVEATSLCTGWFASPDGHIVTAGHCVDPDEGRSALLEQLLAELGQPELFEDAYANWTVEGEADGSEVERTVQVIQPGDVEGAAITGDPLTAQVVDFQSFDDGDVALLRVAGMSDTPALAIAEENPVVGQELTAIGFPGSVSSVVDGARIRASFKSGTASSQQVSTAGVAGTEVNADISPGMSGGPTVDPQGSVYGVNSYLIIGEQQNFNFITDTDNLQSFLTSNNVPFTVAETVATGGEAAEPEKTDDTAATGAGPFGLLWPVMGGLLGLVVLAGAVVLLVVLLRRRQPQAAGVAAAPVPPGPPVGGPPVAGPGPVHPGGGVAPMAPPAAPPAAPPMAPPAAAQPAAPSAGAPAAFAGQPTAAAPPPPAAAPAPPPAAPAAAPPPPTAAPSPPTAEPQTPTAPATVVCTNCGTVNTAGAHFCSNCGTRLPEA